MSDQYTLLDALDRAVEMYPQNIAVRCHDQSWTYRAFRDRITRVASGLAHLGIAPGDRIAVLSDGCHRFIELYWAAMAAGAIVVPIGTRLSKDEVHYLLTDSAPAALVTDREDRHDLLHELGPSARFCISFQEELSHGIAYEALTRTEPDTIKWPRHSLDTPVGIFYTAAVQGVPQGAVITQGNWLAQAIQTGVGLGIGPDDTCGVFLPLYHMFGAYMMVVTTCHGATNAVLPAFAADEAARLIQAQRVTFFAEFAPMADRLLSAATTQGIDLAQSLRFVVGIDLPETINRYLAQGIRWFNLYGQTEVAGLCVTGEVHAGTDFNNYSGRPMLLTRVSLRNPQGDPVPAGESGELWVRSPTVVVRYWPDRPTRLTPDGWLRTGDILRADAAGNLWYIGRSDDKYLIKSGGENVYPAEVEQVLRQHPAIAQACVFGVPDPVWKEAVRAVIVVKPDHHVTPDEVRAFCRERIAHFKCPKDVIMVTELPQTGGQIDRDAVRQRYGSARSDSPAG
jgi:acyl-CoA synthetase (AMP-forming)/AMP-acid ligase II